MADIQNAQRNVTTPTKSSVSPMRGLSRIPYEHGFQDIDYVKHKLRWMQEQMIWPHASRYLWTDAFGVVLLVSLYEREGVPEYLEQAEWVVEQVHQVLGRRKGIRIGEDPDRDGQYFHYLAMWMFALHCLGRHKTMYREQGIQLVKDIHSHFVVRNKGVWWKMEEDLSGPYPGYGMGALDAFHGYVVYNLLDSTRLSSEINEMRQLIERQYQSLNVDQDLGTGMMLWMTSFFPQQQWAVYQRNRCIQTIDQLWIDPPGYFCRHPGLDNIKLAFSNYGLSVGLQAVEEHHDRLSKMHEYMDSYRHGDEYDTNAITHVMAAVAHFPGLFLIKNLHSSDQNLKK